MSEEKFEIGPGDNRVKCMDYHVEETININIRKCIEQWGSTPISLAETGDYNEKEAGAGKEHKTSDCFELLPLAAYNILHKLRADALTRYSAGNHVAIEFSTNIARAIRHIYGGLTLPTDVDGTIISELAHASLRLMMAAESLIDAAADNLQSEYNDWKFAKDLYTNLDNNNIETASLSMFPTVLRRTLIIMSGTDMIKTEISNAVLHKPDKNEITKLLDDVVYELIQLSALSFDTANKYTSKYYDYLNGKLNTVYVLNAILLYIIAALS